MQTIKMNMMGRYRDMKAPSRPNAKNKAKASETMTSRLTPNVRPLSISAWLNHELPRPYWRKATSAMRNTAAKKRMNDCHGGRSGSMGRAPIVSS